MIVFKNYFKIIKKFLPTVIMFTGIFIFFAVITASTSKNALDFESSKPKMAIINNGEEGDLLKSFKDYISDYAEIKEIASDEDSLKDALFYREADFILLIPENYIDDFMSGKEPKIETMKVPDSYNAKYSESLLNKFLNVASVYTKAGMNEKEIAERVNNDLESKTNVVMIGSNQDQKSKVNQFFNFSNYTLLATCIFVIGTVMASFNNPMIKKRNLVSKKSYKRINSELFLGNVCLCVIIWLLYIAISFVMYKETMMTQSGLLMILNSFCFVFVALSVGFLLGTVVKNKEAQNGIVNVVALGSSFLCGAFVPQEFLGDFVLSIARFLPSYWFITNNNDIMLLSKFDFQTLQPVFIKMLIIIGFGILFFIITNIFARLRLKKN